MKELVSAQALKQLPHENVSPVPLAGWDNVS